MTWVHLQGCDDSTMFEMDLTDDEKAVLERVSIESFRRGGGCAPYLSLRDTLDERWYVHTDTPGSRVWREDDPDERRNW